MRKPNLVPNAVTDLRNENFQKQKQNHVKRKILIIFTEIYQKILFFAKVITKKLKFSDWLCRKTAKIGYPKFLRYKN